MHCKICQSSTRFFREQKILGKYSATYLQCTRCGYVFISNPHWLDEAYASAIAALDTGIVIRNLWLADVTSLLLRLALYRRPGIDYQQPGQRSYIDYGGGTGLFVRLMRDKGYDFYWQDNYCDNLFARGFEANPKFQYRCVTCFEVIEHLADPIAGFEKLATLGKALVISTELLPATLNGSDEWHYYVPESGQHIGFFTKRSLQIIAEQLGLVLSSNGSSLHVFAQHKISSTLLWWVTDPRRARLVSRIALRESLEGKDNWQIRQKFREEEKGAAV